MKPIRTLVITVGLWMAGAGLSAAQAQWSVEATPNAGNIEAPAGDWLGWGYSISNDDPTNWLLLDGLSVDALEFVADVATPFDFPALAPGQTVSVAYLPPDAGLFAMRWADDVPVGFVNFGSFEFTAQWWDGDPFDGGQFTGLAPTLLADFSASVSAPIPEPAAAWLLLLGLGGIVLRRRSAADRG